MASQFRLEHPAPPFVSMASKSVSGPERRFTGCDSEATSAATERDLGLQRIVAYEATEALALIIYSETWHSHGLQRRWADSKHQKVEDLVPDLVAGLMRTAIVLRREEEERKKRELERQQRVQEMIKLREQVEAEEKKVKQFDHCIESW